MSITIQSANASSGGASMTLLATLTTTSGTTHSKTGIAAGYRQLYIEVDGVSFTASATLTAAVSSTNGGAYGTARNIAGPTGSGAGAVSGAATISNISSTIAASRFYVGNSLAASGTATVLSGVMDTDTAAVVDAIQFAGGTFDAGTIRIYGVK